ncbi:wax ester/triacylglycerol synthase domain-containing protein [uncultured Paraglaciecola sp.]|uniref:wax ester/triacylglycerol synthase domain-containing protein n=1 Tax=uncultured Paraglaciecola sp. TaxID=1765024 RepID=UPI0030DCAE54|tara:strand:+ start:82038 stop:83501 length:1464 start_codon:yes stop_codon:yes gene_type:complete
MSKKLTFLDKTFWLTESEDNPKHVASLQLLKMPAEATKDYVDELAAEMRANDQARAPFNCRVKTFLGYPLKFVPVKQLDMDYHVQLHSIEDLNDKPSLHKFIASLHEPWLARDKPLWQFHLIKDNNTQQFALYIKIHHMCGDGSTLIRWFQAGYSPEPIVTGFVPVWSMDRTQRKRNKVHWFKAAFGGVWGFFIATKDLIWIIFRLLLKLLRVNTDYMPLPFSGTKTVLTGQVKKGRAMATLDIDFARIKALSKRLRASANEVMLCVFDIAVHRQLRDYGHTFKKALYTNMPINLRKPGETTYGNKIAIVPVELAHGHTDPYLRLREIIENHRKVKRAAKVSHPASFSYYTLLIQTYAIIFEMLGLSNWVKPIANTLVSNMPGPKKRMYYKDSELLAAYPVSTITPGGGVNITMVTYNGQANVGLVCCNNKIDSLEPLRRYCLEAFEMLEKCVDDPSLSIADIGEEIDQDDVSIVDDEPFIDKNNNK